MGGSANDGLNLSDSLNYNYADVFRGEIITDDANNIYVASSTLSSDFSVTSGAFQSVNAWSQDGCVFKLSSDLSTLLLSSYIGGTGDDAAYSLKLNNLGEVVLTGGTGSFDFPTSSGGLFPNYQLGESDGWILKLNSLGSSILAGTYLGTPEYDQAYFIDTDSDNNIYVVGQTEGSYPITPITVYSDSNSGQFLHKLTSDLSTTVFSTTFGTSSGEVDIALSAFLVNECNYIFVSGWGGQTNVIQGGATFSTTFGLPITSNAVQSTTDGSDYYLAMFGENADTLKFATFFGGSNSNDHVDGGTSRFDKRGIVYQAVCASCGPEFDDFPTTTGAYSDATDPTVNCNLGVFKLDLSSLTVDADVYTTPYYCIGESIHFQNLSNGGVSFAWYFGDGDTSNLFEPFHTYNTAGTYNVMLSVVDSISCIFSDTDYVEVYIGGPPIVSVNPVNGICRGDSIQLNATGGTSYEWFPKYNILYDSTDTATVWPDITTTYTVITTDSCGFDTTQLTVTVFQKEITVSPDTLICLGESVQLNVFGANSALWTPGASLNNPNGISPIASPVSNTMYMVNTIDPNSCAHIDSVEVLVDVALPDVFNPVDQGVCIGDSVQIYISGTNVHTYAWEPANAVHNPNDSITWVKPIQDTKYIVEGKNGCSSDFDTVAVLVNFPNAIVGPDLALCSGEPFELWASGGTTYLWQVLGAVFSVDSSFITSIVDSARFYVEVTDADNCKDTASVFVDVMDVPNLEIGPDVETFWGNQFVLNPTTNGITFQWSPTAGLSCDTCKNPTVMTAETTAYYLTVANANGCLSRDTINITYDGSIYVPNSFSPNGDGDNDFFRAFGKGIVEFEMGIYDRWGELLFYTENMTNGWDGTYKGEVVKTETYVWKIKFREELGSSGQRYGTVSLIR